MTGPKKPGPPNRDRTIEARIYLSPAEVAAIDALRGDQARSAWMRDRLLEVVGSPGETPPPPTDTRSE